MQPAEWLIQIHSNWISSLVLLISLQIVYTLVSAKPWHCTYAENVDFVLNVAPVNVAITGLFTETKALNLESCQTV